MLWRWPYLIIFWCEVVVGGKLIVLPRNEDRLIADGFNTQVKYFIEQYPFLKLSGHTIVEPWFSLHVRNSTYFEEDGGNWEQNLSESSEFRKRGFLGFITKRWSQIFQPLAHLDMIALEEFEASSKQELDLVVGVTHHASGCLSLQQNPVTIISGITYRCKRVECLNTNHNDLDPWLNLVRNSSLSHIALLPSWWWENSGPKHRIETLQIGRHLLFHKEYEDKAKAFVARELGNEKYIAVHWRRGDRGFMAEMNFGGLHHYVQSHPYRIIPFLQDIMHRSGYTKLFMATNAARESVHLKQVAEAIPSLVMIQKSDVEHDLEDQIMEQLICAMADLYVTPPALRGNPREQSTSMFTVSVMALRDHYFKRPEPHHVVCCGDVLPAIALYEPTPGIQLTIEGPLQITAGIMYPNESTEVVTFTKNAASEKFDEVGVLDITSVKHYCVGSRVISEEDPPEHFVEAVGEVEIFDKGDYVIRICLRINGQLLIASCITHPITVQNPLTAKDEKEL